MASNAEPVLAVRDLVVQYPLRRSTPWAPRRYVHAVNGIDVVLRAGETLGIVGESGCGKTTLARTIMGLVRPTSGEVRLLGRDIARASGAELRAARRHIQFIFQDPYSSLDPRQRVLDIVREPLDALGDLRRGAADERALWLLEKVGLSRTQAGYYPHQFSGGQRQRINIARALALNPKVVIADEPVSALDVSVRAQILNLLRSLQVEFNLSLILISHDLNVVEHLSDRVMIIYLGRVVEEGSAERIFRNPEHPYTRALLDAIPSPDPRRRRRVTSLEGDLPSPLQLPTGCAFHSRCPQVADICRGTRPETRVLGLDHSAACHFVPKPRDGAISSAPMNQMVL